MVLIERFNRDGDRVLIDHEADDLFEVWAAKGYDLDAKPDADAPKPKRAPRKPRKKLTKRDAPVADVGDAPADAQPLPDAEED